MESVNKARLNDCHIFISQVIDLGMKMHNFTETDIFVVLLGIICNTMKNILKMSDKDAIKHFADAYVTYPEDGKIPVPLRKM